MDSTIEEKYALANLSISVNELAKICFLDNTTENTIIKQIKKTKKDLNLYAETLELKINFPEDDDIIFGEPDDEMVNSMLQDLWNMYGDLNLDWNSEVTRQERLDSMVELLAGIADTHGIIINR